MRVRYNENFLKVYFNIRSAFTDVLSTEINDEDNIKIYMLAESIEHYLNVNVYEEINE